MDEEKRIAANDLHEKIKRLKTELNNISKIKKNIKAGNSARLISSYDVAIPKSLQNSIIMQVECDYKAKLEELEKEFENL